MLQHKNIIILIEYSDIIQDLYYLQAYYTSRMNTEQYNDLNHLIRAYLIM